MTNFEAIVKNNPNYVKEVLACVMSVDEIESVLTGELKHDKDYNTCCDKREMDFLNAEYVVPVLDNIEKKYLSDVIKPFKHNVKSIRKSYCSGQYFIEINMKHNYDRVCLPYFSTNSEMYKGMKARENYTLKELGL